MDRRNYSRKELIIYWKWLSRLKGNRSFTFPSTTRSTEQKLSIHANWRLVIREAKILQLNVGSNKRALYQDYNGAKNTIDSSIWIFPCFIIEEKVNFWGVISRSEKFVHHFPLAFQTPSLRIELVLVSWVVNFREYSDRKRHVPRTKPLSQLSLALITLRQTIPLAR